MTYPDREQSEDRRRILLWTALILIIVVIFVAFSVEAWIKSEVCISAATIDSTGTVTSTPVVCSE